MAAPLRQSGAYGSSRPDLWFGSRFDSPIRDVARRKVEFGKNGGTDTSDHARAPSSARNVLLVSDVRLLRESFAEMLQAYCADLFVSSLEDARLDDYAAEPSPELVILHMREKQVDEMWHKERIARIRTICHASPVLLLSESRDPADEERAIAAGFAGFLPATQSVVQVVAAIRLVLAGGRFHLRLNDDAAFERDGSARG